MDTDDLSNATYKGVIIEAEKFNYVLAVRFGALASDCGNESTYLKEAKQLIHEISKAQESSYEDIFFDEVPEKKSLLIVLARIMNNISTIEKKFESKKIRDL